MKNQIIYILVLLFLISCKKEKEPSVDPCLGGCGLADFELIDYEPSWSPDGNWITYYHVDHTGERKDGIYLISIDGQTNILWHSGVGAENPSWSPDGNWIAFSERGHIWKKKLNGDSLTQVTKTGRNFFPSWSPDGNWIVYHRSYSFPELFEVQGIWLTDIYGLNNKQIFSGNSGYPIWADDDILFIRGVITSTGEVIGDSVKLCSISGTQTENLFFIKGSTSYPRYSSSIQTLLITNKSNNSVFQIYSINTDGSKQSQLTSMQGYTADWSPDGQYIVYTDSRINNGRLWIMKSDGTSARQLTFDDDF